MLGDWKRFAGASEPARRSASLSSSTRVPATGVGSPSGVEWMSSSGSSTSSSDSSTMPPGGVRASVVPPAGVRLDAAGGKVKGCDGGVGSSSVPCGGLSRESACA